MKFPLWLISTNVYISIAAVALTIETQLQLGLKPEFHPYISIIFFATLLDYNLNTLLNLFKQSATTNINKAVLSIQPFFALIFSSILGLVISISTASIEVLYTLLPFVLLTLSYSIPLKVKTHKVTLRQIPYLKIFLISIVWSCVTILPPVVKSNLEFDNTHVSMMVLERFLFVFAITIPFDIRDMKEDAIAGLKKIPIYFGKKAAAYLSIIAIILFFTISLFHYLNSHQTPIILAFSISACITLYLLLDNKIKQNSIYYYGFLDGAMLMQGLLVIFFSIPFPN